jgi:hypothetical protein
VGAGTTAVGASFYKDGSLAMVSRAEGSEGECCLEVLAYRDLISEAIVVNPSDDGTTILQTSCEKGERSFVWFVFFAKHTLWRVYRGAV